MPEGHPLIALVALVLVPGALALHRFGGLKRPAATVVGGSFAAAALYLCWGRGVPFVELKKMWMLLAGGFALVLLLEHAGLIWLRSRSRSTALLGALAVTTFVVFTNFFTFHGNRGAPVFVHLHDVAHYYLGGRYFPELGYGRLYMAMLRAEAQTHDNHFKAIRARDLETNEVVHIRELLVASDPVVERFSPDRWEEFRADAEIFRSELGPQLGEILVDHGFNPTPVWALVGHGLANLFPAGNRGGVLGLSLLDPLLLAAALLLVGRTFGLRTVTLVFGFGCLCFGATFGWTGGAFLRHLWLCGVLASVCALETKRPLLAGAALGLAAALRVFPALLAAGLALEALRRTIVDRRLPRESLRFAVGFSTAVGVLFVATLVQFGGFEPWREFAANMANHMGHSAWNVVGLGRVLAAPPAAGGDESAPALQGFFAARETARLVALGLGVPLALGLVAWVGQRRSEVERMAASALVIFAALDLSSYYWILLVVPVIAWRRHPAALAGLFAIEMACYAFVLFDLPEVTVYRYRSILLLEWMVLVALPPLPARAAVVAGGTGRAGWL